MTPAAPKRTEMHPDAPARTLMHPNDPRAARPSENDHSECTPMHPRAPQCTLNHAMGKTNPPPARGLSLAQHAAIRLLVRGYRVGQIARHLGVSRHTIKRWKRDARFVAEQERLRAEMNAAIVSPAAKATPPPRRMDPLAALLSSRAPIHAGAERSAAPAAAADDDLDLNDDDDFDDDDDDKEEISDEEAAETEAWVNDLIRAKHAGEKIPPPPPLKRPL